ncbi:MAG: hypothetical protein A3B74_03480 [Candidatus Kerfeldbacteria bacterium RIFCSPHIGHO2_02_FULL_42_14]|uniref:Uncharacterized protein n=1 Tax=Candidatus Kerfeldbacteria bacterium RIFCSPHIGHO2_02_FULL_42_14 TaxID=1798540 RepID=A0A1G2ASF4_9BACT|nr:MAG: hypothetical protein A3B74_03480 [Candidatus Kerfeldbacteria bacterium RIFCSPHIGHO2_02_FULL_42_14]OGY82072.1 MAG: hypothetical protein A3E60_00230 [Candidatus Kerfeldbacteria bacterium RIFCSPHIGHO2_12_FULL_42_13]OGY84451.1 MAG: hypothetical protein A3I91_00015 [Candidatus Kerfeldbacteria bacterium RIFCSPLOWO2_02_FULL_42_19]OGY86449.1 MAG: hypothetical protein A3G01_00130 [Candidatus Kerfeldbacteria bacterium RIFCSPLOWO2_12_FULL_43_9]
MHSTKAITSSAYAAITTIAFVVVITVVGELSEPFKEWLKGISGHHWTTKSIFSVLLYSILTVALSFVPGLEREKHLQRALRFLLIVPIVGVLVLFAFYTAHYLKLF